MPGFSAFHWKAVFPPGGVWVTFAPPPGPVTACISMECIFMLVLLFLRLNVTVSPSLTRANGPGTDPLNVQNVYSTPSANDPFFSTVSRSIVTLAPPALLIGGGISGAVVIFATSFAAKLTIGTLITNNATTDIKNSRFKLLMSTIFNICLTPFFKVYLNPYSLSLLTCYCPWTFLIL